MATRARTASEQITETVTAWPGVTAGEGSRGEFAFRLGRRELGHLHGDRTFHVGLPKPVWHELHDQGRIDFHPVFPGAPGYGARRIAGEDDVRDVIAILRMNYDRAVERHGLVPGLHALPAGQLSFAPRLEARGFLLEREQGNVVVYGAPGLAGAAGRVEELGGATRQYLSHWHEAMFDGAALGVPLVAHEAERGEVEERGLRLRGTFSRRHTLDDDLEVIPIPGHTAGATALLWHSGGLRVLFTGDTVWVDDGRWVAAVLGSSDRDAYVASLELLRDVEFDALAPWVTNRGAPAIRPVGPAEARRRLDVLVEEVRDGGG